MASSIRPGIYDESLADEHIMVETEQAQQMVLRMARAGILLGPSSGAVLVAAREIASGLDAGNIVTVLPDSGQRYLGEDFVEGDAMLRVMIPTPLRQYVGNKESVVVEGRTVMMCCSSSHP